MMDGAGIRRIPVDAIDLSASPAQQARRSEAGFDGESIAALAATIAADGLIEAPTVRTAEDGRFELVAGERRLLAVRSLGWTEVPAVVRDDLDDRAALVVQLLENVQRENPEPLTVAEAFGAMRALGMDAHEIAARAGVSTTLMYSRLRLLDLGGEERTLLREGRVTLDGAVLLARFPAEVRGDVAETVSCAPGGEPPRYADAYLAVQERHTRPLGRAPFGVDDPLLGETTCTECPHRTGSQPGGGGAMGPDTCLLPSCYAAKSEAGVDLRLEELRGKGQPVAGGKTETYWDLSWSRAQLRRAYVDVDRPYWHRGGQTKPIALAGVQWKWVKRPACGDSPPGQVRIATRASVEKLLEARDGEEELSESSRARLAAAKRRQARSDWIREVCLEQVGRIARGDCAARYPAADGPLLSTLRNALSWQGSKFLDDAGDDVAGALDGGGPEAAAILVATSQLVDNAAWGDDREPEVRAAMGAAAEDGVDIDAAAARAGLDARPAEAAE